ncbi:hypothetical protein OKA04_07885 [Luteolibacter flavescens]|uniref:Uncharacterized protein n=1 Tax=Luteolibacter flavescens TaxID=1859460 RepID=A0ABT3FMG7_9BACT|nr:hypothetical protein [Luteolibacter flavescens]MCW1884647.1 hypothetical protein [Luteolibacter flavescens]
MIVAPPIPLLASTPALRPVFLIVMGAFLLLTAWRMTRGTHGWTPRLILGGALMLAFGYSVVTPLYQAGIILPMGAMGMMGADPDAIVLWHAVRLFSMNVGWLVFGTGMAMHAGLFETAKSPAPVQAPSPRTTPIHGPVA